MRERVPLADLLEQPSNWELASHMGHPRPVEPQMAPRPEQRFAQAMRDLRSRKGWSQDELATRLSKIGYPIAKSALV